MKIIKNVQYADKEECLLDIYLPDCKEFNVFVYFHGGGLEACDKTDGKVLSEYLTSKNVAVVSANYRMYPEAKFPDYLEDASDCVSWVFKNICNYGECRNIYVGGSSAGAYISMMLCFDSQYLLANRIRPTDISGFIHDAGQPTTHFNVLREQNIDTKRIIIDEKAPLFHIGKEDTYSKMIFIVSDHDMPCRYEQTMLTLAVLKRYGHEADFKLMHGRHCEYIQKRDEQEESIFGKIILTSISKWENCTKCESK